MPDKQGGSQVLNSGYFRACLEGHFCCRPKVIQLLCISEPLLCGGGRVSKMTPKNKNFRNLLLGCTLLVAFIPAVCHDDSGPAMASHPEVERTARMERFMLLPPPSLRADVALTSVPEPAPIPPAPSAVLNTPAFVIAKEERPALPVKKFVSLTTLAHAGAAFDSWSTNRLVGRGGEEANPIVKPVAGSPAIYPVMQLWPVAMDYVALKMARSEKPWVRRMWWLPQTLSAAASFTNGFRNVALANSLPAR